MNERPTLPLIPDLVDIRRRGRTGGRSETETIDVGHILPFRSIV